MANANSFLYPPKAKEVNRWWDPNLHSFKLTQPVVLDLRQSADAT